jgi:hypothetical protein
VPAGRESRWRFWRRQTPTRSFAVGERVRIASDSNLIGAGATGTIIETPEGLVGAHEYIAGLFGSSVSLSWVELDEPTFDDTEVAGWYSQLQVDSRYLESI